MTRRKRIFIAMVVGVAVVWAGSCRWSAAWAIPRVSRWWEDRTRIPVRIRELWVKPLGGIEVRGVEFQIRNAGRLSIEELSVRYEIHGLILGIFGRFETQWKAAGLRLEPSGERVDWVKWTMRNAGDGPRIDRIRGWSKMLRLHGAGQAKEPGKVSVWLRGQASRSFLSAWGVSVKRQPGWEPFYLRFQLGKQHPRFYLKSRPFTFGYGSP